MQRLGAVFARFAARWLPDPLVLAFSLTILVAAVAVLFPQTDALTSLAFPARLLAVTDIWFARLWGPDLLAFALQMCLILLGGFALAATPPARRAVHRLAVLPRSNRSAVALVALVSALGCWINWGFGLIAAGLFAQRVRRELADRAIPCQHALLVAAAYSGMMIWHAGLSGSAPLRVAQRGVEAMGTAGSSPADSRDTGVSLVAIPPLPITRTTLHPVNLATSTFFILGIPLLLTSMAARAFPAGESPMLPTHGPEADVPSLSHVPPLASCHAPPGTPPTTPAARIDRLRLIPLLIAACLLAALIHRLARNGVASIDLNFVIAAFFAAALLLHRDATQFIAAVAAGSAALAAIVIQFPLYAGIQGLMADAGLAAAISNIGVSAAGSLEAHLGIAPRIAHPIMTFLSAGLLNVFIPSGGGQWIVQGPIVCAAAQRLGLPIEQAVMAVAYGDQWTNMIQPFWALPLMGLTGVNPRQFVGYCVLLMILAGPLFSLSLILMR